MGFHIEDMICSILSFVMTLSNFKTMRAISPRMLSSCDSPSAWHVQRVVAHGFRLREDMLPLLGRVWQHAYRVFIDGHNLMYLMHARSTVGVRWSWTGNDTHYRNMPRRQRFFYFQHPGATERLYRCTSRRRYAEYTCWLCKRRPARCHRALGKTHHVAFTTAAYEMVAFQGH